MTKQTVLVDPQGWTLYELPEGCSNEQALEFLRARWFGPYTLKLVVPEEPELEPCIMATFLPTGHISIAAIIHTR